MTCRLIEPDFLEPLVLPKRGSGGIEPPLEPPSGRGGIAWGVTRLAGGRDAVRGEDRLSAEVLPPLAAVVWRNA